MCTTSSISMAAAVMVTGEAAAEHVEARGGRTGTIATTIGTKATIRTVVAMTSNRKIQPMEILKDVEDIRVTASHTDHIAGIK